MSVIDDWIAQLSAAKISDSSQPLESTVATAIAALTAIQLALAAPPGPEPAHTFLAGPLGGGPANPTFRLIDVTDLPGGSLINQFRVPFGSATGSLTTSPNFLFGSVDAQLVVSENAGVPTVAAPPGTVLHLIGSDANAAFLDIDGYGNGSPTILTQRANGTAALPTPIPATATLMNFQINGYGATGYFNGPSIIAQATENWSDASHGSRLRFSAVKNGTAIVAPALAIENDGSINIGNLAGTIGAADAPLYVNRNVSALPPSLAGLTIAHFGNADGNANFILSESFGNQSGFIGRRANGTAAAPTALLNGDTILAIIGRGRGATNYPNVNSPNIGYFASENWTDLAQGTKIGFSTTKNGTVASVIDFVMENDGTFIQSVFYTVATLPVANAANKGGKTFVTDALAPAFAAIAAGGGAVFTPVYSDGVAWRCG